MSKRKIVFVISRKNVGGIQKIIKMLADYLSNYFDVHIISIYSVDNDTFDSNRVKYIEFNLPWNPKVSIYTLLIRKIKIIFFLREVVRKLNPELICAFNVDLATYVKVATLGLNVPIVGSERGAPSEQMLFRKFLSKVIYPLCDGMVFQTQQAMSYYGNRISSKSTIIPNPFIEMQGLNESLPVVSKRENVIVTAAARFDYQKNIETLIRAFYLVNKEYPDHKLIIYGPDDQKYKYFDIIYSLNLQKAVNFPGIVNNVGLSARNAKVFVLPSRYEGIPNVLIEVLSMGIPTVSTDCPAGGPALLTANGKRGLLVKVGDAREMANAILRIIEDNDLSKRLSVLGKEVKQEFPPEIIFEKWASYFNHTIDYYENK